MDHMDRLQSVNSAIAKLMCRLRTISSICGGEFKQSGSTAKTTDFLSKKSALLSKFADFYKLCESRDSIPLPLESRDRIRIDAAIRSELGKLEADVKDLALTHEGELAKTRTGQGPDEVDRRNEVMQSVVRAFEDAYKQAKGYAYHGVSAAGAVSTPLTMQQLEAGDVYGAEIQTRREELTGDHMQTLSGIAAETREQEALIIEISSGMDVLLELSTSINDEICIQTKILEDLDGKADTVQLKVDRTNDRMQNALKLVNDKSTNMCMYVMCICILLGLATIALKLAGRV